jgi:hypothetical protein
MLLRTASLAVAFALACALAGQASANVLINSYRFAAPAVTGGQELVTTSSSLVSGAADRFLPVGYSATASGTEFESMIFPVAGQITAIRAYAMTLPGAGNTWDIVLRINGVDTAVTCQITNAANGCEAEGLSLAITAGQRGTLITKPVSGPTNSLMTIALTFVPTTAGDTIIPAQGVTYSTTVTQAVTPFSNATVNTPANRRINALPDGGTIDKFYVKSNAPGGSASYAYTVDKGAATTALTTTITGAATDNSDLVNSFTVVAGDDIQFEANPHDVNVPASATATFGARFRPTTTGSFIFMKDNLGTVNSSTAITYYPLTGGGLAGSATPADAETIVGAMTLTKIRIKIQQAPGAAASGKHRIYRTRVNGVQVATCQLDEDATEVECAMSVAVNDNDRVQTADDPDSTNPATTSAPAISYLANK